MPDWLEILVVVLTLAVAAYVIFRVAASSGSSSNIGGSNYKPRPRDGEKLP